MSKKSEIINYKVAVYWKAGKHKLSIFNCHLKGDERALNWARKMAVKLSGKYNTLYINDRRQPKGMDLVEKYNQNGVIEYGGINT
jgi:hypothetical protein